MSEQHVLRPVALDTEEAALFWRLLQASAIPGSKARIAARALDKIEAATQPAPEPMDSVERELAAQNAAELLNPPAANGSLGPAEDKALFDSGFAAAI